MQGDWQSALDEWERLLRERLTGVTLLGELELKEADRDCIAAALRSGIAAMGPAPFMQEVKARWPVTLTAYLVVEGMFSYRKGALWPHVCARLGLPRANYPARWGRICVGTVRQFGKPDFHDLVAQEHASRYLTVILAHGGIPNSCLPDLFRYVPGRLGRGTAMPRAAELMGQWRADPQALHHVDRPVRRFLLYGGKIAEDFLDRYLRLVGYAREHATVPGHSQVGLPAHVVDAYRQWQATRAAQRASRQRLTTRRALPSTRRQRPRASPAERRERASARRRASWRIAAPFLALDPYNASAVVIHLPRQRLNDDQATKELTWIVQDGNNEEHLTVHLWQRDKFLFSEKQIYEIRNVTRKYHVTLLIDDQFKRYWPIDGVSDELPLLAFRDNATMKSIDQSNIPSDWIWLMIHNSLALDTSVIPETEIQLTGIWSDYTAFRVNLEDFYQISLKQNGDSRHSIPLNNPKNFVRFAETPILTTEDADGEIPIFAAPPTIGIPLDAGREVDAQLRSCSLSLSSATSGSRRRVAQPVHAIGLEYTLSVDGGVAQVALTTLLPSPPLGVFELHVQRALGQDQRLRFAVVPGLRVEGHDKLVLPFSDGRPQPTTIHVYCPASGRLVAEHNNNLRIHREPMPADGKGQTTAWRVDIDAALDSVTLYYEERSHNHGTFTIPLTIPVPRLRWSITGLATEDTPGEPTTPRVSQHTFTAAPEPTLVVTVPDGTDLTTLRVVLTFPRGTQEIPAGNRRHRSPAGRWSFSLGICRDTVRAVTEQAELSVILEVQRKGQETPDQLEVLRIVCPPGSAPAPRQASSPPSGFQPIAPASPARPSTVQPITKTPSVPLAPPKTPPTKSAHPQPGSTQEVAVAQPAHRGYSFAGGIINDSSTHDPNIGLPFRKAPDPKSFEEDSNGNLVIKIGSRIYAPSCNKCNYNRTNTAIWSSHERGSIVFQCKHRIPVSEVIIGQPLR